MKRFKYGHYAGELEDIIMTRLAVISLIAVPTRSSAVAERLRVDCAMLYVIEFSLSHSRSLKIIENGTILKLE